MILTIRFLDYWILIIWSSKSGVPYSYPVMTYYADCYVMVYNGTLKEMQ